MLERIAVIGMAGRFPGATDLTEFWQNLVTGTDCLDTLDDEELLRRGEKPEFLEHPGYVRKRPRMQGADMFDARCFGMTPREAELRDPQQRIMLEVAHSAIEDAGYDHRRYDGAIGVFAGTNLNRYRIDHLEQSPTVRRSVSVVTVDIANAADYVATFIAHRLGLRGPAMTVQSACSTALVAIHTACLSLAAGDCDMAVAGAANVEMPLDYGYVHLDGSFLASDGTPRPFDADADGTNFGSGAGAVVLKRLSDALADGDRVLAVVRGTAVNNDGDRKSGFSTPSVDGQAECIAEAIRRSGVDPRDISYVEAHGTGTAVGDPIEMAGLVDGFRRASAGPLPSGYCRVGSVKGNVGHMGQASGVCGFIKAVLALRNGVLPPTINVRVVNPRLELAGSPFVVNRELTDWSPAADGARRAGVSSFGIGGTNAHVVLEAAPPRTVDERPARDAELIVWSGSDLAAVEAGQERLAGFFADLPRDTFADAAHTLRTGRRERDVRAAVVARDPGEAGRKLADGRGVLRPDGIRRELVFCFPGQGSQYPGMGHRLYHREPDFRDRCDEAFDLVSPVLGRDLRSLWLDTTEAGELAETAIAQPLLFVVEYALARTLIDWGLHPARLIGHSVGEVVAGTVAGVFGLADALQAIAARSRLMQEMPRGCMLAVSGAPETVGEYLGDGVALAAVNGPRQCVLSGPHDAVQRLARRLRDDGIDSRRLAASHAFHSSMMEPAARRFEEMLGGLTLRPPDIPVVSCATGSQLAAGEAVTPAFWARQLVEPVNFAAAVRSLTDAGSAVLVEVGPGNTLTALLRSNPQVRAGASVPLQSLPTAERSTVDLGVLEETLGRLWAAGFPVDLARRDRRTAGRRTSVPGYPYQRKRHWVERPAGYDPPRDEIVFAGRAAVGEQSEPELEPEADPNGRPGRPAGAPELSLSIVEWTRVRGGRPAGSQWRAATNPAVLALPADPAAARIVRAAFQTAGYRTVRAAVPGGGNGIAPAGPALRVTSAADWDALFARAELDGREQVVGYGVLFGGPQAVSLDTLDDQLAVGYFGVLECVRAMFRAQRRYRTPMTLILLTSHAVDVTGAEPVNPATAMLHALLRTVEQEYHGIRCVAVDADPAVPVDVLAEAVAGRRPPVLALRGASFWQPVLRQVDHGGAGSRLRRRGVYLVTGGFGGIGLVLARALAETGLQPRLALLGRSGPPAPGSPGGDRAAAAAALAGVEEAGAEVLCLRGDAGDPESLRAAVDEVERRFGAVNGVVHGAGIPGGGLLDQRVAADSQAVFHAKVRGALAVDACFADRPPLDFMLLMSSLAGTAGMLGGGDYAAANAFLDAFATQRHDRDGAVTVSVAWPAWSDVGMWASAPVDLDAVLTTAGNGAVSGSDPAAPDGAAPRGYRRVFDKKTDWELDEHRFDGVPVLPATASIELVVTAVAELDLLPDGAVPELRDVVWVAPIGGRQPVEVSVGFSPRADTYRFEVRSRPAGTTTPWTHHAHGVVARSRREPDVVDPAAFAASLEPMTAAHTAAGLEYGPRWDALTAFSAGDGEYRAALALPDPFVSDLTDHPLHAALLDAAGIAVLSGALRTHPSVADGAQYLPFLYRRMAVFAPLVQRVLVRGRPVAAARGMCAVDLDIYDADTGRALVSVGYYAVRETDTAGFGDRLRPEVEAPPPGPEVEEPAPGDESRGRIPLLSPHDGVLAFHEVLGRAPAPVVLVQPPGGTLTVPGLPWTSDRAGPDEPSAPAEAVAVRADAAAFDRTPDGSAVAEDPGPRPVEGDGEATTALGELWSEALGLDGIGLDDDFFEVGGDSLIAVQLSARIRQRFGVEFSAAAMFDAYTIRRQAAEIAALSRA